MDYVPVKIKRVSLRSTGESIPYRNDRYGFILDVSSIQKNDIDTVIDIELR
jgi:hypothetical protein